MDTMALVRQAILGDSAIVAVIGDRCWCPNPDKGYDAEKQGPGVSFFARGGDDNPEIKGVEVPNVQVVCWAVTSEDARSLYSLVRERLNGLDQLALDTGFLMSCSEVNPGQDVVDPDTDWSTVVSFYQFWFRPLVQGQDELISNEESTSITLSKSLSTSKHVAIGAAAVVDEVTTDDFPKPQAAMINASESLSTAEGEIGIFADVSWSPTSDVPTGDYEAAAMWARHKVNLDGQATADTYLSGILAVMQSDGNVVGGDGLVGITAYAVNKGNAPQANVIAADLYVTNYTGHLIDMTGVSITRSNGGTIEVSTALGIGYAQDGGSCGKLVGIIIEGDQNISAGTVQETIGLEIQDQTIGAVANHAILTHKGLVEFGDHMRLSGVIQQNIIYSAAGTALPSAFSMGMGARAFVSDAASSTFNAVYVGGGTNKVPVFSDGSVWRIG